MGPRLLLPWGTPQVTGAAEFDDWSLTRHFRVRLIESCE